MGARERAGLSCSAPTAGRTPSPGPRRAASTRAAEKRAAVNPGTVLHARRRRLPRLGSSATRLPGGPGTSAAAEPGRGTSCSVVTWRSTSGTTRSRRGPGWRRAAAGRAARPGQRRAAGGRPGTRAGRPVPLPAGRGVSPMSEGRRANPGGACSPPPCSPQGVPRRSAPVLAVDWLTGGGSTCRSSTASCWRRTCGSGGRPCWAQAAASVVATFVVYLRTRGCRRKKVRSFPSTARWRALAVLVIAAIVRRKVLRFREVEAAAGDDRAGKLQSGQPGVGGGKKEVAAAERGIAVAGRGAGAAERGAAGRQRRADAAGARSTRCWRAVSVVDGRPDPRRDDAAGVRRPHTAPGRPATAAAILEQEDELAVQCHQGSAPAGSRRTASAGAVVRILAMTRGRTAYLEDRNAPDLKLPQPKDGQPVVSVLAALRVGGWPVGTLELQHACRTERGAGGGSWSRWRRGVGRPGGGKTVRCRDAGAAPAGGDPPHGAVRARSGQRRRVGDPPRRRRRDLRRPGGRQPRRRGRVLRCPRRRGRAATAGGAVPAAAGDREGIDSPLVELLLPGGRRVALLIHAAPIKDKDGKVTGASGPWWTSRRRRSCSENWTCGGGRRRRRRCRKTRFLAAVSHDIRTPANAISLLAELIRRTASNPALAGEVPSWREMRSSAFAGEPAGRRAGRGAVRLRAHRGPGVRVLLGELLAEEYRRMQPLAGKGLAAAGTARRRSRCGCGGPREVVPRGGQPAGQRDQVHAGGVGAAERGLRPTTGGAASA